MRYTPTSDGPPEIDSPRENNHPEFRERAIFPDVADEHDYVRVALSPSQRSIPFYRRFGFGADGRILVRYLMT